MDVVCWNVFPFVTHRRDEAPTKRGADAPGARALGGAPFNSARRRRRVQRQRGPRAGERHRRHDKL